MIPSKQSSRRNALVFVLSAFAAACRWETDLPSDAKAIHVDPDRELLVTDERVIAGELSRNRTGGALSFRHAFEALSISDDAPMRWLDAWSRRLSEEYDDARARTFDAKVTCRWLRATPENECDESCSVCTSRRLSMELAPFRLIAVVNRTDLSAMPDRAADGGEGRLVFALTDGPADDATSPELPFAVILEYAQAGTPREWEARWHSIASAADFGEALTALTERFVAAGSLAQLRTADALTGPMVFHQFRIEGGAIVPANVRNTPDWKKVEHDAFRRYASDNAGGIANGTFVLPASWLASSSSPRAEAPSWIAGIPQRDALARQTCAGCHAQSDSGFHVDPVGKKRSRFLADEAKAQDELRRRVEWMQLTLASSD